VQSFQELFFCLVRLPVVRWGNSIAKSMDLSFRQVFFNCIQVTLKSHMNS